MIFYTITVGGKHIGNTYIVEWAGTQADARQSKKDQEAKYPGEQVEWVEHDVPTDKPKLLAWLKEHAVRIPQTGE